MKSIIYSILALCVLSACGNEPQKREFRPLLPKNVSERVTGVIDKIKNPRGLPEKDLIYYGPEGDLFPVEGDWEEKALERFPKISFD